MPCGLIDHCRDVPAGYLHEVHVHSPQDTNRHWRSGGVRSAAQLPNHAWLADVLTHLQELSWGNCTVVKHPLAAQVSQGAETHVPKVAVPPPRLFMAAADSGGVCMTRSVEKVQPSPVTSGENDPTRPYEQDTMCPAWLRRSLEVHRHASIECSRDRKQRPVQLRNMQHVLEHHRARGAVVRIVPVTHSISDHSPLAKTHWQRVLKGTIIQQWLRSPPRPWVHMHIAPRIQAYTACV